jgi:intein-encoded DNA endonuclease-like protein
MQNRITNGLHANTRTWNINKNNQCINKSAYTHKKIQSIKYKYIRGGNDSGEYLATSHREKVKKEKSSLNLDMYLPVLPF